MQKSNLFQRRILPALLALCMTLSLLPGTALAAQPVVEPAVLSEMAVPQAQSPATWRFLFVILKRNNITYRDPDGKTQKETTRMSTAEVNAIKFAANDFKKYFEKNASALVKPVVDIIEIDTPITDLSNSGHTKDDSLWIRPEDCYPLIRPKVDINKYDQIFAVANLNSIKTFYWGLTHGGGGFFQRTGYSFINTLNKDKCLYYFNPSNAFPSGLFVHEFLHTMEAWNENRTGKRPETDLHTREPYGYDDYEFYAGYINKSLISGTGTKVGIDPVAWANPPYSVRSGVKTATITFHANGGYRLPDSTRTKRVTSGKTYGALPTPSRPGYDFVGWFASGNIQIQANDKVSLLGDVTLYAHWKPAAGSNIYTVTLDRVAGAIPTKADTRTVEYGKPYGDLPELKRDNYTFNGWYTAKTGGKKVTAETIVSTKKDHTLYARWAKNASLAVTLNPNGGNFDDDTKTKTVTVMKGASYGDLANPVRKGYTFAGWYTAKTGGKQITSDTTVTASGKQTLYARWVKGRTFLVTFDANGGEAMLEYKAVVHAGFYGALPTPVRNDYHFAGWWTKKTGGVQIRPETKVGITAKQTLYAHWIKGPVTVVERKSGNWTVTQPAGYELPLYGNETAANRNAWYSPKSYSRTLTCTRRVTLSNGVTRYQMTTGNKTYWFTYSCEMNVK